MNNKAFYITGTKVLDIVSTGLNVTGGATCSGQISDTLTTDASSVSTGAITTLGGISTAKKLYVGTSVNIPAVTNQIVLGTTNTTTISSVAPASSRVITIPDALADSTAIVSTRGAVTQATSIVTGVTLNSSSGIITTVTATTAAGSFDFFTLTNSLITTSTPVLVTQVAYSGTNGTNGSPISLCKSIASGSISIYIYNTHATNALNGTLKIAFLVC